MKEVRNTFKVLVKSPGKYHMEGLGMNGRIILEWTLKKKGV
jgi:hypothetical protein